MHDWGGLYIQSVGNGIVIGLLYALIAVSFNLIYGTCRFFHFAHSVAIAFGAYGAYVVVVTGLPAGLAWCAGITIAALSGLFMNIAVYEPLRRGNARPTDLLVASLGLMVAGAAALSLIFGDDARMLANDAEAVDGIQMLGANLSITQVMTASTSIVAVLLVTLTIRFTRIGAWVRAVGDNPELAYAAGLPVKKIIGGTFITGSALAGLAGLLVGYDSSLTPDMGLRLLLMGVSASIIGGLGTNAGAVLGGLLIGLTQNLGAIWLPTQWQDGSIFLILIAFLLMRPQGFVGRPATPGAK